jgi:hypothetical protein|tara:strand:+ start:133 stop:321 length:189 start_codon:yes stop_codon:yes gene_type:complete
MNEVVTTPEEKVDYAQTIINILQTRLNEQIAQNIQLEAKLIRLTENAKTKVVEPDSGDKGDS